MQSTTREQIEILQQKLKAEEALIRLKTLAAWTFAERGNIEGSFDAVCAVDGYCAAIYVDVITGGAPSLGDILNELDLALAWLFFTKEPNNGFHRGWYSSGGEIVEGAKYTSLVCPVGKLPFHASNTDSTPGKDGE